MSDAKPRSGQVVELQSLRGIAALTVAIGHTLTYYYYDTSSYGSMVLNGRGAVVVFFVISGYVLTCSLRNSPFDRYSILKFWMQRAFRIYPAMWVATALSIYYLVVLHWRVPLVDGNFGPPGAFRIDRFNLLFIGGSFTGMVSYALPQLWSIHVEIVGSLAMPLIAFVALHRQRWVLWVLIVLGVAISYIFGDHTIYNSALFFLDFIVGAAIAVGAFKIPLQKLPAPRLFFVAGLVGLSLTRFLPIAEYYSPTAHLIETVLAALLVGLLVERDTPQLMRSNPLLFIGKISYSIYLLFFVVMCVVAKASAVFQIHEHIRFGVITSSIVLAVCTTAVLIPSAWWLFNFAEQPGIRLGKRVLANWHNAHVLRAA